MKAIRTAQDLEAELRAAGISDASLSEAAITLAKLGGDETDLVAWKKDAEERMAEATTSINLQIERGNSLALLEAKASSDLHAALSVIERAKELAAENWNRKSRRVLAERLRYILEHAPSWPEGNHRAE